MDLPRFELRTLKKLAYKLLHYKGLILSLADKTILALLGAFLRKRLLFEKIDGYFVAFFLTQKSKCIYVFLCYHMFLSADTHFPNKGIHML